MEDLFSPPKDRICLAQKVLETEGCVIGAERICSLDHTAARLVYNDQQPSVLLDLGPLSPGGYPVFRIKLASPDAKLRVCYYDWLQTAKGKISRKYGDFVRGSCKYLGVELPVLPANPNRYECYTLNQPGEYLYPLIQGQQRFVRILLEEPGSFVELETFYIYYTSDNAPYAGSFDCADPRLRKLWYASTYTAKLATIQSNQWDTLNGKLLLRSLAESADLGFLKDMQWRDFTLDFSCKISVSPDFVSGISWAVGITGGQAVVLSLLLDSRLCIWRYQDGVYRELVPQVKLHQKIRDNYLYHLKTVCRDTHIIVFLEDEEIFNGELPHSTDGKIGFCQQTEQVAVLESFKITARNGCCRKWESFDGDLPEWEFARSPWFTADGAKRDRLPWSGDLVWAGPNIYYAYRENRGMRGALELLAFHQNSQGYVYGTCYPENREKPGSKQWGNYESDLFSMWHAVSLAEYVLFSGDIDFLDTYYDCLQKNLDYLWRFVDARGLFYQRYETSKGLWDHELGDKGIHAYHMRIG